MESYEMLNKDFITLEEFSKVCHKGIKVLSAYNGKVLCYAYDRNNERHKEIGERNISSVWAELDIKGGGFGKYCTPILCCYVDGTEECRKAHPEWYSNERGETK